MARKIEAAENRPFKDSPAGMSKGLKIGWGSTVVIGATSLAAGIHGTIVHTEVDAAIARADAIVQPVLNPKPPVPDDLKPYAARIEELSKEMNIYSGRSSAIQIPGAEGGALRAVSESTARQRVADIKTELAQIQQSPDYHAVLDPYVTQSAEVAKKNTSLLAKWEAQKEAVAQDTGLNGFEKVMNAARGISTAIATVAGIGIFVMWAATIDDFDRRKTTTSTRQKS